jgi:hypothetical protein
VPYIIRHFHGTQTAGSAGLRAADLIIYPPEIAAYGVASHGLLLWNEHNHIPLGSPHPGSDDPERVEKTSRGCEPRGWLLP